MLQELEIEGPQGRRLEVEVAGPADGPAVVFHTGTPSAGTMFAPLVAEGASRGLRHVCYARPGYAESDRRAGRTVGDCAEDVAAIADQLGLERFFTAGVSGGGPHALACAALLGERVLAAASIAGVAPRDAEGLDWLAGMGEENRAEFGAAEAGERQLVAFLERLGAQMADASGPGLEAALGDLLSDADREALTGELAEHLSESTARGLAHGVWGWFDDDVAHLGPWGFELASIEPPVTVWHGRQDRFVPVAHGEWLARHVPGAQARVLPEHGHLSLFAGAYGAVLDGLLAGAAA